MKKSAFYIIFCFTTCLNAQLPSNWIPLFSDDFNSTQLDTTLWKTAFPWARSFVSDQIFSKDYNEDAIFELKDGYIDLIERKKNPFKNRAIQNECIFCTDQFLYNQLDSTAKANCRNVTFPISSHAPDQLDKILLRDGNPNERTFTSLSKNLVSRRLFKYGKYEMRFKFINSPQFSEKSRGHWQSFWLFGGTEIDIFEMENAPKKWYQKKKKLPN
ncbi:MAG: family 16 glycosylhydrolase [Saprospiraceae bacterium]|nr:family 16 glycosylhydrolase [Saprospiraceae bacterium]